MLYDIVYMAEYLVKHNCGHSTKKQILGDEKDHPRRIAALKTKPCRRCFVQNRDKVEEAQPQVRQTTLMGSSKQIEWANAIRNKTMPTIYEQRVSMLEKENGLKAKQALTKLLDYVIEDLEKQTQATWFIERKNSLDLHLLILANTKNIKELYNAYHSTKQVKPKLSLAKQTKSKASFKKVAKKPARKAKAKKSK